ncbi:cyclic lactone autoinducer peptide [Maledivibacter halophilus]|uniref:Cyclic lactone autoinducer peptide n=1 Tax=Maledivibacter halophilus TaxID=36842 RepID=A0A1T5MLI4_9FIRM|nr:cyclic lactone autoinducer peptide [Maledivibacter halophilus]SKC89090.1 cyclic lactone autoinducer peptide [Maledivibacter halophilus]
MKKRGLLLSSIASIALFFANMGAGTCSYVIYHQPKFPEKLRK